MRRAHHEGLVGDHRAVGRGIVDLGVHRREMALSDIGIVRREHVDRSPLRAVPLDDAGDCDVADRQAAHCVPLPSRRPGDNSVPAADDQGNRIDRRRLPSDGAAGTGQQSRWPVTVPGMRAFAAGAAQTAVRPFKSCGMPSIIRNLLFRGGCTAVSCGVAGDWANP
jgi:hypothetical protein